MRTTVFKDGASKDDADVRIQHNGDWSGLATLNWHQGGARGELLMPGWVAKELSRKLVEEAATVDMSGAESDPCPGCGRDGSIKCMPSGLCYCDVCHFTFDVNERR